MDTSKGKEYINEEGAQEIKVETTNYQSPPGEQLPRAEKVEVTHLPRTDDNPGVGGAIADTATKVAEKIESVKDSVLGTASGDTKNTKTD